MGTNYSRTSLAGLVMTDHNWSDCLFEYADLTNTDFTGGIFNENVSFRRAILDGANFTDCEGVTAEQIKAAKSAKNVTMPDGSMFVPPKK
jgi:uncharacterized protein YjbI with pentapeptide repeats